MRRAIRLFIAGGMYHATRHAARWEILRIWLLSTDDTDFTDFIFSLCHLCHLWINLSVVSFVSFVDSITPVHDNDQLARAMHAERERLLDVGGAAWPANEDEVTRRTDVPRCVAEALQVGAHLREDARAVYQRHMHRRQQRGQRRAPCPAAEHNRACVGDGRLRPGDAHR